MAQAVPYATSLSAAVSQDTVPEDRGAAGLWQTLRKLDTWASLMLITAHPDDEDGGMLTFESRGAGVRTIAAVSYPRRRRAERNVSGLVRCPRTPADAGIVTGRSVLRYRTIVDARRRLRILEDHRRGLRPVGQGTRAL